MINRRRESDLNSRSYRKVIGNVLLRADDNFAATTLFQYKGITYPVIVFLDTANHSIVISSNSDDPLLEAGYLSFRAWRTGNKHDKRLAIYPFDKKCYIAEARRVAEVIAARIEKDQKESTRTG